LLNRIQLLSQLLKTHLMSINSFNQDWNLVFGSIFMFGEFVKIIDRQEIETYLLMLMLVLSKPLLVNIEQYVFPLWTRVAIIILILDFDDKLIILSGHYDFSDILQQYLSSDWRDKYSFDERCYILGIRNVHNLGTS